MQDMPEGMGRAAFPKGDTQKAFGEIARMVGGKVPAGLSPVGSHSSGTGIGLVRQSCQPALARSKEARPLHSPPIQHRAFSNGEDPFSLLSQTPNQTRRPRVPYRSCGPFCPR